MPIKHQTESFRNRNGLRFECEGDICEGDVRAAAKARCREIRAEGRKAFYEVHPEGYARVFATDPLRIAA